MATSKELIKFLKLQRFVDTTTIILVRTLSESVAYDIDTIEKLGTLTLDQKGFIISTRNKLNGAIEEHYVALGEQVSEDRIRAAELAGEIATEYVVDTLTEMIGPKALEIPENQRLTSSMIKDLARDITGDPTRGIENAMARMQGKSYRPLSRKIYHTTALSKGQLNRMINSHLAAQSSGRELARDIRQFVRPTAPGGIRSASLRLGRTELNNAFHAVTVDQAKKNPLIKGMRWNLSGTHPNPDECNDYADTVFKPWDVPSKPHPNCLCYLTPETISDREFQTRYGAPKTYEPLTRDQFSDPDTPRTRAVSTDEFNKLAAAGERRLAVFSANASDPIGLDKRWNSIKDEAWDGVQKEWGGVTIDAHTGLNVTGEPNKYALTVRPPGIHSVTVPMGADRATFNAAMEDARTRFHPQLRNENYHLGVFRDDAISRIDIDPVLVLDKHADVESIGAYTHAKGGAYNFADGLGYWPPHIDKRLDHAGGREAEATVQRLGGVVRAGNDSRGPP